MKFVILSFAHGDLIEAAIIFGKYNIKLVDTNTDYNIYQTQFENNTFYFPIKKNNRELEIGDEENILKNFPYLNSCKKIILIPEHNFLKNVMDRFYNETIFRISIQGDPCSFPFDEKVNMITSVKPNGTILHNFIYDIKLCIPYFFYRHQISLVNFELLDEFSDKHFKDKLFFYLRRFEDGKPKQKDRAYFIKKLKEKVSENYLETFNPLLRDFELSNVSVGLYHLGNFFDYNSCMFNMIFESQKVDRGDDRGTWISEKSIFAVLFANPFFLLANPTILKAYKELGIELLNDEFVGNNIEEKFDMFCELFTNGKLEDRKNLFLKMKGKQKENRKKILDYIYSPKTEVIKFIIKQYE